MKNSTTFFRESKTDNYTVISNLLILSKELTSDEKNILFHILSLPDDWIIYKTYFENYYKGHITKGKLDKAWKGLMIKGYLKGTKVKDENGKFTSWTYEVKEKPSTDIPITEGSENGVVKKPTSHNSPYIQSTNSENTNKQNTNTTDIIYDTSIILGEKDNNVKSTKRAWSQEDIQRQFNLEGMNSLFENTGINWTNEISKLDLETFIKKYQDITNDEYKLKFLSESYLKLNPQLPRRG